MKSFFILILFFCIDIAGLSQTIDSASIVITYRLKFLPDSNSPKTIITDIDQLCIGNKISQFYSYIEYRSDSMLQSDLSKGTVTLQEISSNPNLREKYPRPGPLNRYQLYINYPENKTTTTDFIFSGQYFFEEQNEVLDWTILSDTTQFLGNNCQKALTTFRGRSYIAWFPRIYH